MAFPPPGRHSAAPHRDRQIENLHETSRLHARIKPQPQAVAQRFCSLVHSSPNRGMEEPLLARARGQIRQNQVAPTQLARSEEHTSELQSHHDLVCRLLLEKKKQKKT